MSTAAAAAPSGVVTFLFTDIEGSTRRWEADADAMRAALAAHDEVLRSAIEAHGGWLFKHTGDGVCAAFPSPRSAVDAAVAAQRRLRLPVRMGMATGEAEMRGRDYFGVVLNRAARVMATGHGGQILLADSTAGLLSGVDVQDLGPRRLRDVPTPVGIFQVHAPGLATDFPPLRGLDPSPGNLPRPTNSLIGRDSELDEVHAAIRAHRLVTLTGVGGVGKTRLALAAAAGRVDDFPDGVWFFELAAVTDPASVPDAVAAVLRIAQQPNMTVSESIAAALQGRMRLLVFDNCEHLRDAAADLVELILARSATVQILTTSREGLGIPGEQLWSVPALDLSAGIDSAAVDLFVERACHVVPGFAMTNTDEVSAVVEICRRLDGIPLAIELAASRMAAMTPDEVRGRLDQRFRLLVDSQRGPSHHQTLYRAVAWSYDLLDDAEKSLLQRCSVFAGGFTLDSACGIAGSSDEFATLDLLGALVRKSLLVADRSSPRTRFSMLETIRQFAEQQLAHNGASSEARATHARYFAEREADVMTLWDSPRQREAYDWFTTELANLRTAYRWAADRSDLDTAAAIATSAAWLGFWTHDHEPAGWAEELIVPARDTDHPKLAFLYAMASSCWWPGRVEAAVGYSDAGQRAIACGSHDEVPFGFEGALGAAYLHSGQPERQVEWCRSQLACGRDTHGFTRAFLAIALTVAGRGDEARSAATGLVELAEATGNPAASSFALYAFGYAFGDADPTAAIDAQRRGLAIAEHSGNRNTETRIEGSLARLEAEYGDPVAALDYVALAIRNFDDAGNTTMIRFPLTVLAAILDRLGRAEPAATIAGFASSPLTATANPELAKAISDLRGVLGDQTYESLAHSGAAMTPAVMAAYAYDQIDQARTVLIDAGESA